MQSNNCILVIIVTYNGLKWLNKCLSSVINSSIKADLFIIDNGSTDESVDFIKNHFRQAVLIESHENLGFGKANNIGLKYAIDNNYDYVYLLNQDAWVEKCTFEKLVRISKSNPDFGIISPMQANRELTKLDFNFVKCCPNSLLSDLACKQHLNEIYSVEFVMAAHWFLPIQTVKMVGGFSPVFQHYGEDHNYIHRAKYHGFQIGITPSVFGVHDREHREDSLSKQQYLFFIDNLVVLSNPLIRNRYFRIINNYIQTFFRDKSLIKFAFLIKLIKNIRRVSKIERISLKNSAFLIP